MPPNIFGGTFRVPLFALEKGVLAVFQGGDARVGVNGVRPAVVDHVDPLVGHRRVGEGVGADEVGQEQLGVPLLYIDGRKARLTEAGEVLLRTAAGGICGSDLGAINLGTSPYYEPLTSFPYTFGHENVGRIAEAGPEADIKPGNTLPLENIPLGTHIHNIELRLGKGGQIVRSAGTYAQLMAKEEPYALLKLPSGEVRMVLMNCRATIGQLGNVTHESVDLGKAGRKRHMGRRPEVRGTAMNPIDHPHGGGEGRAPIGMSSPKSPWGKKTLGKRTRFNKRTDKYIVRRRVNRKKR